MSARLPLPCSHDVKFGHASKVFAAEYRMALLAEKLLADHVDQVRRALTRRVPQGSSRLTRSKRR